MDEGDTRGRSHMWSSLGGKQSDLREGGVRFVYLIVLQTIEENPQSKLSVDFEKVWPTPILSREEESRVERIQLCPPRMPCRIYVPQNMCHLCQTCAIYVCAIYVPYMCLLCALHVP